MAGLEYSVEGNAGAQLSAMMARLADVSDLMPRIGALVMDSMKKDIEESREPGGSTYPPLKRERKAKNLGVAVKGMWGGGETLRQASSAHPYAGKPLLDTTNMYQSIHFQYHGDVTPGIAAVWAGPSLEQAPYFPYQNQGAPKAGIPQRAFIGLRGEDVTEIEHLVTQHNAAAVGSA